jgi:hypothetical protein
MTPPVGHSRCYPNRHDEPLQACSGRVLHARTSPKISRKQLAHNAPYASGLTSRCRGGRAPAHRRRAFGQSAPRPAQRDAASSSFLRPPPMIRPRAAVRSRDAAHVRAAPGRHFSLPARHLHLWSRTSSHAEDEPSRSKPNGRPARAQREALDSKPPSANAPWRLTQHVYGDKGEACRRRRFGVVTEGQRHHPASSSRGSPRRLLAMIDSGSAPPLLAEGLPPNVGDSLSLPRRRRRVLRSHWVGI